MTNFGVHVTTKRVLQVVVFLTVIGLAVGCATTGTGDPVLVRSEDALVNALSVYEGLMDYHFANSTKESPATYKAIEGVRAKFPVAWQAVYDARALYKARAPGSADKLTNALETLRALVHTAALLAGGGS